MTPDDPSTAESGRPTLAAELRDAMRPIWRELASHRPVSMVRLGALGRLDRGGRATAAELAAHEHVTPQAMTTVVREFERDGLVVRTPDEEDRRRVWIEITGAGRATLHGYRTGGDGWLDRALVERLDAEERAALVAVLPVLRKLAGEQA